MTSDRDPEQTKPLLVLVDDDSGMLAETERELVKRYGVDYEVACTTSVHEADAWLRSAAEANRLVAAGLADPWMPACTGVEFLASVREVPATTKRALLIAYNDQSATEAIVRGTAMGQIDAFLPKPAVSLTSASTELSLSCWKSGQEQTCHSTSWSA